MNMKYFSLTLLLLLCSSLSFGNQSKVFGDYIVKYHVVSSEQLSQELIRRFMLKRDKNIGYVQIEVVDKSRKNTPLKLSGKSNNMVKTSPLRFKHGRIGGNNVHFAEFEYRNRDVCYFEIDLLAPQQQAPYRLKFSRSLNLD